MAITSRKPPRYLGISCLVAGACFLFDPFLGVFDFLPDAIGYLLFAIGLYWLSDMDDRLGEASRAAGKLALLGVARIFAMLLTFALVSPTERPVFTLLMVFTLGVLDLLMFIPLWKNLSGGLVYLGARADGTVLFDRSRRGGRTHVRNLCERYTAFSTAYFVLREVLVVLPEMTVLTHESGGDEWSADSLYNFVGMLRIVGFALSLILGIVWLARTISFVRKLKSDKPLWANLHHRYETEVLVRRDLFAMRAVKAAMVSLGAAAVLSLDFYLEGVSMLPDYLAAILMILSVKLLSRYAGGKHRPAMIVSVLYGISAAVAWSLQLTYLSFNELPDVLRDPQLSERLTLVTDVQAVTSLLFLGAYVLILRLLYDITRRHTGLRALREGSTYAVERTEAIHTRIRKKLIWVGVFAALSAASAVLLWGVMPRLAPIDLLLRPQTGEALLVMLYDFFREAYWVVDVLLGGGLVALTIHAGSEIFEQMDYTYLMN